MHTVLLLPRTVPRGGGRAPAKPRAPAAANRDRELTANEDKYIESNLTYGVVGCAIAVIDTLGHGLRAKTYERALRVAFGFRGFSFQERHIYPVYYRGRHIDD
jgi:hypothetical protein